MPRAHGRGRARKDEESQTTSGRGCGQVKKGRGRGNITNDSHNLNNILADSDCDDDLPLPPRNMVTSPSPRNTPAKNTPALTLKNPVETLATSNLVDSTAAALFSRNTVPSTLRNTAASLPGNTTALLSRNIAASLPRNTAASTLGNTAVNK